MIIKKYLKNLRHDAEQRYKNDILRLTEKQPDAVFLDCGCDTGDFTTEIGDRIGTKKRYGIDIVETRLCQAKKKGITIVKTNLNSPLPFKDNFFDVVSASQVIEHLFDLDNFVTEIYRILKPEGYALLSTENLSSWHNIFALMLGFQPFSLTNISTVKAIGNPLGLHVHDKPGEGLRHVVSCHHVRVLSYSGLKDIFEVHGFQVTSIKGAGYYPFPRIAAKFLSCLDKRHAAFLTIKIVKRGVRK